MEINDSNISRNDRRIIAKLGNTFAAMAGLFKKKLKKKFGTFVKDAIIIEGIVEITNGDTHIIARNSFVNQGLAGLVSFMSTAQINAVTDTPANGFTNVSNSSMRVGQDTVTPTQATTTLLASAIGGGFGTVPNTQSISNTGGAGQWQVTYTATWNAGILGAVTLGEVGLFLKTWTAVQGLQPAGLNAAAATAHTMFSRMASADLKFTSFLINTSVPLAIAWTIRFTFVV